MTVEVSPITGGVVTPLVDAATIAWSANQGFAYSVTLGGSRTLANPSNAVVGAVYSLFVTQGAGGSKTLGYGGNYNTPSGAPIVLSTIAFATDILVWQVDASGNFSLVSSILDVTPLLLAPTSVTASVNQMGQVTLGWVNASSNQTHVHVEQYGAFTPGQWDLIATLDPNITSYIDPESAGDYTYRVSAARGASVGPVSNSVIGTAL